ncbi:OmpA family protein [Tropicibacter oceani]|uniref:OmpA family protein n=1 Tax=Tropicibacter oceani TaxID=3058420 RepID=A0ABY8QLK9_9RHOB|nr:OmpA family protein [Tropicibacter oceani]WGW04891.1 OmpA family protein [Tropicibacter oceani]
MMNTTRRRVKLAALVALLAGPTLAQDLALPQGAALTREFEKNPGAYDLPVGPWTIKGGLPTRRVEGAISTQSWRIEGSGLTPLQIIAPLREQLVEAGYDIVLDCVARACGGFDFRFATLVLPAPQMFVDLTDFHALSAVSADGSAVALLASRDATSAYLQIIRAGAVATGSAVTATAAPVKATTAAAAPQGVAGQLESQGHAILRDLVFETGSSSLAEGAIGSLDAIAAYLAANPARRVLFVGHTDAVGSLEGNQALSRKRAMSAVAYLRNRHDIPENQVGADGVGYLAPVASNLTAEGREANRRVEAVLIPVE